MKKYQAEDVVETTFTIDDLCSIFGDGMTAEEIAAVEWFADCDKVSILYGLLPERERRLFICELAVEVLSIYEDAYPEDRAPRRAIEAGRRYGEDPSSENRLALEKAGYLAWGPHRELHYGGAAKSAARDEVWLDAWATVRRARQDRQIQRLIEMHKVIAESKI